MRTVSRYIIPFLLLLLFQVFLFNWLTLFRTASPFIFPLFIFMLPHQMPRILLYVVAFSMGLLVDIISGIYGLHAFSLLFAAGARGGILGLTTSGGIRELNDFAFYDQRTGWYAIYLLPLFFIHHLAYFLLESFSFQHFGITLLKIVSSTIYSFIIGYLICIVFYKR